MKLQTLSCSSVMCALALMAACSQTKTTSALHIPHLQKRGAATQLIVDGKPYLALAGEMTNTASSSPQYMNTVWPNLVKMHLNTVLAAVAWDWIEPAEGKVDFTLADRLIQDARSHHMRLVFLWFASWKNGLSSFVPVWVKANQERFPRAQVKGGKTVEVLSTLSEANREADSRAFAAFMRHVRDVDSRAHTVIMIQVENEVGLLGDSRDRSPAANEAFAKSVPPELMDYLRNHKDSLLPEFRRLWEAAGFKTSGSWEEVFGKGPAAEEVFMGWNYARYVGRVAGAGKAEYPIPMFVNAWRVQPQDKTPGDYPSGGPQAHMHDLWRAGAPQIDILSLDVQSLKFPEVVAQYTRSGNPLFIPESRGDAVGAANVFYAVGQHNAIGYSVFGLDLTTRLLGSGPGTGVTPQVPLDIESLPLPRSYAVLSQLAPLILEHQGKGTIAAAWLAQENADQKIQLGDYTLNVELTRDRRTPNVLPERGYGIFISVGPDEYVIAGNDVQVTFSPNTPGPEIAGLASVETGTYLDGRWIPGRRLAGDDCVLRYDLAAAASVNQSGSGVRFRGDGPSIQHVKLYRYR